MDKIKLAWIFLLFLSACCSITITQADSNPTLKSLQAAYPDSIKKVTSNYIDWRDGTRMPVQGSFPLFNHLMGWIYLSSS